MKNKANLLIATILLSLLLGLVLVACNPGKMEDIVGTYQLVADTYTEYQQETVDKIAAYGKESYLVVTGKEKGYYVYKDNDTAAYAREIKLEYTTNDENNVSLVTYVLDVGEKPRTFHVDVKKDKYLISRWPSATKIIAAYNIEYKKVSNATDLSAVKKIYGELPVFGYNLYKFNSFFCAELTNGHQENFSDYIYKYYDVNSASCTATLYYAEKSDQKPVVVKNLPVNFERNQENDELIKVTIGDVEYDLTSGVPAREVKVNVSGKEVDGKEELGWFDISQTEYKDYASLFQSLIDKYVASLQQA